MYNKLEEQPVQHHLHLGIPASAGGELCFRQSFDVRTNGAVRYGERGGPSGLRERGTGVHFEQASGAWTIRHLRQLAGGSAKAST